MDVDHSVHERSQRLWLRVLGLSFEEPSRFWRWYRACYGLAVLTATIGYGICYEGVSLASQGGDLEAASRNVLAALLALAAYAVALVDARNGVLPPPEDDDDAEADHRARRVPPPPPPPRALLCVGIALFVAAHVSAILRRLRTPQHLAPLVVADVFMFLPRLGPLVCLVLRCGALARGVVHVVTDDDTHDAATQAVDAEGLKWRAYVAGSAVGYALLGLRDICNAYGLWGPRRADDAPGLVDDTLHAALTSYHLLAPLVPIADLNGSTRRMLGRFVRQREIHAYLLLKHKPPLMRLYRVAPTRAKVLALFVLLLAAYTTAVCTLILLRHPLLTKRAQVAHGHARGRHHF